MKIETALSAGFCFGVKRAVDLVYKETAESELVYTYGPIIHNEEVTNDLSKKGVKVINSMEELKELPAGTIIIRSHGVSKAIYDELVSYGHKIIDATCPYVLKIHRIVMEQSEAGRYIIIIGNRNHPEVQGIIGWCKNTNPNKDDNTTVQKESLPNYIVMEDICEAEQFDLPTDTKICIVSQTTYNYNKFQELVEIISKKGYDIFVLNTICNATEKRQSEAYELAKKSDAMIVIGSKQSSNTRKLYEICKKECENTYYIQKLDDLDLNLFKSYRNVGITAGASTPNNIIKEVLTAMSEKSFEQLLEEEKVVEINNGDVVEGIVLGVKEDEIILNIGYKSEGIITRNEYTNTPNLDLTTVVKVGDKMQAKVLKVNDGEGQVALTYKRLAAEKGNKRLEEAFNNHEVLSAKVAAVLNGGLSVIIDEARVFIPASLISDSYEKDLTKYAGEKIEFVITEFNPKKRRIIGDRKQLIVAKKEVLKKALFEKIQVGMTVEGTVKNITDFGAFIDLGGADGLLHISEMSWGRVENPKKVFKVGDTVKAYIKDIQGEKIALSLKFENENPWIDAETKYAVGNTVTGVVARMTDFGAFVELEPGIDALLHVSQISREHVEKPADALKIGQEITAKVVELNKEEKKISLSIKALEAPDKEETAETASDDVSEADPETQA
ncbi:bifunctional 4-hydroxy-3-methylbut-2-enyl diphosphate reductase/30S ribosomal protein S1 [Mobilitalea sibirica]|uniref:4-hydroxy-3-methylbut-2-enyl diphosphate reductase n=1 Tax=Mobilitalea sibirica TaxID=1462919 RepID=A0A8J7KUD8_9FIRM|nr:bifunctional 4-hydroxy-3-methylbut-2-enyl diphosphate reductase/30S ribosomal protein S1 [Mobilitalea sibirica]MBH1942381.1 bifunctional 4-hydroxy-3-methylbut-2-enyl diphosphate reductase/30S ribosomal protein S1 [Mobilitalea sibirica]